MKTYGLNGLDVAGDAIVALLTDHYGVANISVTSPNIYRNLQYEKQISCGRAVYYLSKLKTNNYLRMMGGTWLNVGTLHTRQFCFVDDNHTLAHALKLVKKHWIIIGLIL